MQNMKYSCCWLLFLSIFFLIVVAQVKGESDVKAKGLEEGESHKLHVKNAKKCKYRKGPWGQCDVATKIKKRVFTLKKGDKSICEPTKTIQKECKVKANKENKKGNGNKNKNGGNGKVEKQEKQKLREKNRENRKKLNGGNQLNQSNNQQQNNQNKKNNRGNNGNGNGGKNKKDRIQDKKAKSDIGAK